jgi:hypothetical protein
MSYWFYCVSVETFNVFLFPNYLLNFFHVAVSNYNTIFFFFMHWSSWSYLKAIFVERLRSSVISLMCPITFVQVNFDYYARRKRFCWNSILYKYMSWKGLLDSFHFVDIWQGINWTITLSLWLLIKHALFWDHLFL